MANPTTPILNPNPKTRFQSIDQNISKHRAMVDDPTFRRSADFALLHYGAILAQQQVDFQGAAAMHFKMAGAREFLQELLLLAETMPKPSIVKPNDNLDPKA